jgi:hypothetical protein
MRQLLGAHLHGNLLTDVVRIYFLIRRSVVDLLGYFDPSDASAWRFHNAHASMVDE